MAQQPRGSFAHGDLPMAGRPAADRVAAALNSGAGGGSHSSLAALDPRRPGNGFGGARDGRAAKLEVGVSEVRGVLSKLGLLHYLPAFVEAGFDMMDAVRLMDEADMREECGMTAEHASMLQTELAGGLSAPVAPGLAGPAAGAADRDRSRSPARGAGPPRGLPAAFAKKGSLPPTAESLRRQVPESASNNSIGPCLMEAQAQMLNGGACMPMMGNEMQMMPMQVPMMDADPLQMAEMAARRFGGGGGMCPPGDPFGGGPAGDPVAAQAAMAAMQGDPMATQALMAAQFEAQQNASQAAAGQTHSQFYALAQLAEESAQMNASAAAFCASPADPLQIAMVTEAAKQAAQRAFWAVSSMAALEEQLQEQISEGLADAVDASWTTTMKQVAQQAADAAEQAAQSCKTRAEAVGATRLAEMAGPRKSKVPCKNHLSGHCIKGMACEFSHDPADMQARPLMLKSMKPCMFFAKGHCMRGPACPFAHGDEERAEIEKYVDQLKREKKMLSLGGRRP